MAYRIKEARSDIPLTKDSQTDSRPGLTLSVLSLPRILRGLSTRPSAGVINSLRALDFYNAGVGCATFGGIHKSLAVWNERNRFLLRKYRKGRIDKTSGMAPFAPPPKFRSGKAEGHTLFSCVDLRVGRPGARSNLRVRQTKSRCERPPRRFRPNLPLFKGGDASVARGPLTPTFVQSLQQGVQSSSFSN